MITALLPLAIAGAELNAAPVCAGERAQHSHTARVAAASSLRHLWPQLATRDRRAATARVSFASSGNLLRQLRQGAPFGLFLSANADYADTLLAEGLARPPARVYALGELVIIGRAGVLDGEGNPLGALATGLNNGRIRRIAIANPRHAPYGLAAHSVLQRTGLVPDSAPWLSLGENAAQALQFLLSGAVDAALVPRSLGLHAPVPATWSLHRVDTELHAPIRHKMVLLQAAGAAEEALFEFLLTPVSRRVFASNGFALPALSRAD